MPVKAAAHTSPSARTATATTGRRLRERDARVARDRFWFLTRASCARDGLKWKRRHLETRCARGAPPDQTQDVDSRERIADLTHEGGDDDRACRAEKDRGVVARGCERPSLVGDAPLTEVAPQHRVVLTTLQHRDDRVGRRAVHELSADQSLEQGGDL